MKDEKLVEFVDDNTDLETKAYLKAGTISLWQNYKYEALCERVDLTFEQLEKIYKEAKLKVRNP